jgi:hypothetical protein
MKKNENSPFVFCENLFCVKVSFYALTDLSCFTNSFKTNTLSENLSETNKTRVTLTPLIKTSITSRKSFIVIKTVYKFSNPNHTIEILKVRYFYN